MRKFFRSLLQIVLLFILYEISYFVYYFIISFIMAIITKVQILHIIFGSRIVETIIYTILPIAVAVTTCGITNTIFKKGIMLSSIIVFFILLSYAHINNIVLATTTYGIVSWEVANSIWASVILFFVTYKMLSNNCQYLIDRDVTIKQE